MPSSTPGGYRIADEIESSSRQAKPPWPPTAFFFLTMLFGPLGGLMFGLNWARLGFPEKRLLVFAAGLVPLVFTSLVPFIAPVLGMADDRATWRLPISLLGFGIAYWQLLSQRPQYEAHLARGGRHAGAWLPWVLVLVVFVLFMGVGFLRGGR